MQPFIVAIDFDGTIAENSEQAVPGQLMPNAREVITWLHNQGCYIIIWTARSGLDYMAHMYNFLETNEIPYDKVNENADFVTFTTSRKIWADVYIDDRGLDTKIDWLQIKEKIRKKIVKKLADEICKMRFAQTGDQIIGRPSSLMMRGKPNSEIPDAGSVGGQGMGEGQQKMYDGADRSKKKYDQLGLPFKKKKLKPSENWVDQEALLEDLTDTRGLGESNNRSNADSTERSKGQTPGGSPMASRQAGSENTNYSQELQSYNSYPNGYDDEREYYYKNPKGKGDVLPSELFKAIETDAVPDEDSLTFLPIDTEQIQQKYRRDPTQKYLPFDQKLHNKRYWQEQTENRNWERGV